VRKKQLTESGYADICRVLRRQIDNIWAKVTKEKLVSLEDFFDVKVEMLPHLVRFPKLQVPKSVLIQSLSGFL